MKCKYTICGSTFKTTHHSLTPAFRVLSYQSPSMTDSTGKHKCLHIFYYLFTEPVPNISKWVSNVTKKSPVPSKVLSRSNAGILKPSLPLPPLPTPGQGKRKSFYVWHSFKINCGGSKRNGSVVKIIGCSTRRPGSDSQNPHGGSQPHATLVPRALSPSSDLRGCQNASGVLTAKLESASL